MYWNKLYKMLNLSYTKMITMFTKLKASQIVVTEYLKHRHLKRITSLNTIIQRTTFIQSNSIETK